MQSNVNFSNYQEYLSVILREIPELDREEAADVLKDFQETKIKVCWSCRSEIHDDAIVPSYTAWSMYQEQEGTLLCGHCGSDHESDSPSLIEWLHLTA